MLWRRSPTYSSLKSGNSIFWPCRYFTRVPYAAFCSDAYPQLTGPRKISRPLKIKMRATLAFTSPKFSESFETTESIRRLQPTAIYLRGKSPSGVQTESNRRATQSLHQSSLNRRSVRTTAEFRNKLRTTETYLHTESYAVCPLSLRRPGAAPIPIVRKGRPRFAGNRCNDNRPMQMADSSTHT